MDIPKALVGVIGFALWVALPTAILVGAMWVIWRLFT
jgi:hypothetical protein